jgi:hypothetical protein
MRVLYNNLIDDADVEDVSSEASGYDAEKLQNTPLSNEWRTEDGDISGQYVVFDFGAATAINCVVISSHNISSGATIKFEMHTADAWGAPDLSETLTWRESHIIKFFTSTSKQYCRFYIDDPANTDNYLSVGRVFAGTYLQITPSSNVPFTVTNSRNDVVIRTDQGAVYGTKGITRRIFEYDFTSAKDAMIESWRDVYDECGKVEPLYLANYDSTFSHFDLLYGTLLNDLPEDVQGESRNNYTIAVEECF